MNEIKVIQTEQQHRAYLEEVHSLIIKMPPLGTPDSDRLELLTVLIEDYENTKYPVEPPDPIDAILFRMQEKALKQTDLIPYFGTRSRVSEVLNRKRPLTVTMIRALANGLGISAETLIGVTTPDNYQPKENNVDWSKFPVKEMVARGWVQKIRGKLANENVVQEFISSIGLQFGEGAAFKRTLAGDAYSPVTKYALYAWLARIVQRAREKKTTLGEFQQETLSSSFLREIAQLSRYEGEGIKLAIKQLEKNGIAVIIETHLKGTMLDGAALKDIDGTPIIGLTLRHDRIDNFWFTLLHELAHLWRHIGKDEMFLDDLDASSEDKREVEANRIAREAFIPRIAWKRSEAYISASRESIDALSRELKIHPAIIAGRIRREKEDYKLFPDLVGNGEVRKLFTTSNLVSDVE